MPNIDNPSIETSDVTPALAILGPPMPRISILGDNFRTSVMNSAPNSSPDASAAITNNFFGIAILTTIQIFFRKAVYK